MKTTPTLGLKLYDGTDAPDLVSGYNASMATLDKIMVAYDGVNRLLTNGKEIAVLKMASIEGLELLNGRNPVGVSSSVTISEEHGAGEDFNNLVNAGVEAVTFNGGGAYPVFISFSLASSSASISMPAIGAILMPDDTSITITAILPAPKPQSTEILAIPLIITVRKAYKSVVQLSSNDAGYINTNNGIRVTPFVYSIGEAS